MSTASAPLNRATYGPEEIPDPRIVPDLDNASYFALTGQTSVYSPFEPERPYFAVQANGQPWDSKGPDFVTLGIVLDASSGLPVQKPFTIPAPMAGHPNVQAVGTWQTYASWVASRSPTNSKVKTNSMFGSTEQNINVGWLFTQAEADSFSAKIAADDGVPDADAALSAPDGAVGAENYIYDPSDSRRVFDIVVQGTAFQMALLVQQSCASGVGYPGKWTYTPAAPKPDGSGAATLTWAATVPVSGNQTPITFPYPTRALISPPEKLAVADLAIVIENTDFMPAPAATEGGLTAEEHGWLQSIYNAVPKP